MSRAHATEAQFRSGEGTEVKARVTRLVAQSVALEIYDPSLLLRASEVLAEFKIVLRNRTVYSGHAVVRNFLNTGATLVYEVALDESSWISSRTGAREIRPASIPNEFKQFVKAWQSSYLVTDSYKAVIADLQTFLIDLRLWLDHVELGLAGLNETDRTSRVDDVALELRPSVSAALANMFERFEFVAGQIPEDLQPAHGTFGQRQLHPHLLCAPFIHRTYSKPLGYAGDYEMMNMIVRNGLEGKTLYAKLVNAYLLDQVGPQAVRSRVNFLERRISEETSRCVRANRTASVYCIACGPAREVENFLAGNPLADQAEFRLLDFNEETLSFVSGRMDEVKRLQGRKTRVNLVRNPVQNLLKSNGRSGGAESEYDLIYCSGLYDYLNDRVVRTLNNYLYDRLRPGGLLVVGNFGTNLPVKHFIEHFLEWFLIYRDRRQFTALSPAKASLADCNVISEETGTNIFLEVRKPE